MTAIIDIMAPIDSRYPPESMANDMLREMKIKYIKWSIVSVAYLSLVDVISDDLMVIVFVRIILRIVDVISVVVSK